MSRSIIKVILLCIAAAMIAVLFLRKPLLEKYRETRIIGGQTATIDVCLEKGADSRKVSRALDDAWQRIRGIDGRVGAGAIDEAVNSLRKRSIRYFLIDAAAGTYASGLNCRRRPWKIAIKNPGDKGRIIDVVEISNASVSTRQKGMTSVTVIAPLARDASALAKTACESGSKEGMALIDSKGKRYAGMIVNKDKSGQQAVFKSANYKNFQIKKHSR
jgi:hypothetical protein